MAIIRWNPWNLDRLFEDDWDMPTIPGISRLVGQGLNLYEKEDAVVAEAALPGIPEDKIDVTLDEGIVRITGSREEKQQQPGRRSFMNYLASSYNYSFRLPEGLVKDQEPQAELQNGVLTLTFPKTEKVAPKKIKVLKKTAEEKKAV